MRLIASAIALAFLTTAAGAQPIPSAVTADPPPDRAHPAGMAYVQIPSGGVLLNGVVYTASGAGPHPTLLLLHGFPGNEQNLDLAQAVRRAGFNVLTLHYRGSWGSPGVFSFTHAAQDAQAAMAFLRDPKVDARFAIDPAAVFVAGHSMGGLMAASAAAHDPGAAGLIMISAWNIGAEGRRLRSPGYRQAFANDPEMREDVIPLSGTSLDALIDEAAANADAFDFASYAPALRTRPVLLITADDGSAEESRRLAAALRQAGDSEVTEIHMATDHPYSDHRIQLEAAVVDWLQRREPR